MSDFFRQTQNDGVVRIIGTAAYAAKNISLIYKQLRRRNVNDEKQSENPDASEDIQPIGAIVVTGILLVTILIFWFGTYLLNYLRGS